jgi:parallel beta-helix repeat protein
VILRPDGLRNGEESTISNSKRLVKAVSPKEERRMWKKTICTAATLILGAAISFAGRPQTIVVQGQSDISVDRQAVQDAIDAAQPGDTVELVGTFQFDGTEVFITKSRLTLTGRAVDNDSDGEVNEDWTDGVDNDGDGEVDEDDWDAGIRGIEDENGDPEEDFDRPTFFNRAVRIKSGFGDLRGIAVRHLKFYTVLRGVAVIGGHSSDSHDCGHYVYTGDEIDGVVVEKNLFDTTRRGAQIFGTVANVTFRDNIALGSYNPALLVAGDEVACRLPGDESEFTGVFSIGRPQRIEISGNRVVADPSTGILVWGADHSTVRDNAVETDRFGISLWDNLGLSVLNNLVSGADLGLLVQAENKATVMHNVIRGGNAGVFGWGDSPGTRIANNTIFDSGTGAYLHNEDLEENSNFTLANNEFWNSGWVDVYLGDLSHDNTVIATDFETTVIDDGYDNRLIGTLAMIHNPGISEEVRQHLEEVRERIAAKKSQ